MQQGNYEAPPRFVALMKILETLISATPLSWTERISQALNETHQMLRPARYPTQDQATVEQTSTKQ